VQLAKRIDNGSLLHFAVTGRPKVRSMKTQLFGQRANWWSISKSRAGSLSTKTRGSFPVVPRPFVWLSNLVIWVRSWLMDIFDRIAAITHRIKSATPSRAPEVTLVAVSKVQPDERLVEALESGQRVFGENRVQEAQEHWGHRRADYPDLRLHLIGPLQTNKAADAVALFDVIETLDRPSLAAILSKLAKGGAKLPRLLVQVNTGQEAQKAGIAPEELAGFLAECRDTYGLTIEGLMCIPPVDEHPAMHFALLEKLAKRHGLATLSMGMSDDFEVGIAFGATHVRVGSALFGARVAATA
jgi:PLP dependent protein